MQISCAAQPHIIHMITFASYARVTELLRWLMHIIDIFQNKMNSQDIVGHRSDNMIQVPILKIKIGPVPSSHRLTFHLTPG